LQSPNDVNARYARRSATLEGDVNMPRHKSTVANFVSYFSMLMLFLLIGGQAAAQSAVESADKGSVQTTPAEPANTIPVVNTATDRTKASPERVRSEADLMNAKADTKGQPGTSAPPPLPSQCTPNNTIHADVVAIAQPIMLNRLGAAIPDGLVFALESDTIPAANGQIQLRPGKRPRPLVLRANVGDCLTIKFTNKISGNSFTKTVMSGASTGTTEVSLHVQGMEWVTGSQDDGSFVGRNNSSLASAPPPQPPPAPTPSPMPGTTQTYTLFAREEGTFLLYTMGDTSTEGLQLTRGLFGAVNVQPAGAEWYRSQVTQQDLKLVTKSISPDGHPVIDYNAKYADGTPILKMLDASNNLVHSDLTAIITGPKAGRFPGTTGVDKPEPPCDAANPAGPGGNVDPLFCQNPAAPDRKQPYREFTIIYHGAIAPIATQAFPILDDAPASATQAQKNLAAMTQAGQDSFAINYGTGGIGAEIYANRIGVGPMGNCVDCKFEEFFLSAWSVGDPAMLVDLPANVNIKPPLPPTPAQPPLPPPPPLCTATQLGDNPENKNPATPPDRNCANARQPVPPAVTQPPYTLTGLAKATQAYYPDDPSNVYHSYINDHLKFRILHGGRDVTHVHHQHAHQWLQSPNSDEGSYLDSQMISPGASYTLEMVYNGSGNRNKVVGDSIFHCHFYPHFAAGMWAMWRTHDVFESGTELDKRGIPLMGARALPDGEIMAGTPIPAIVPLPTIPMAPLPSPVFINQGQIVYGTPGTPDPTGKSVTANPGFPFFIPGIAGARAPHPPLDFAPDGAGGLLDGGLPRHVVTGGSIKKESHNQTDWSKDLATMKANQLPEAGTNVEQVAMKYFGKRCYATFFPDGTPGSCPSSNSTPPQSTINTPPTGFILNGLPLGPQHGAPFADPAVDDNGNPINIDPITHKQRLRIYKAAAIQLDVTFNKQGWHFPQQRMLTLWGDVAPTLSYKFGNPASGRKPEPLFFRGNSGDIIEYWHTNLVPNYYLLDDFQVRTPTDILGQHIHLVKFDVTSSDGAGNGFNYEDGTFSPEEVQDIHNALTATGGSWTACAGCTPLRKPQPPPAEICAVPNPPAQCTTDWLGAQTTIQRWYLDPQVDDSGVDRTLRTVFTHDHFGPSTHQQAGLYAGLLVEPMASTWTSNDGAETFGSRSDGGPTSWQARIITKDNADSYREFMLEFQDLQLAYQGVSLHGIPGIARIENGQFVRGGDQPVNQPPVASLVTTGLTGAPAGTQSVNYANELISSRLQSQNTFPPPSKFSDLSYLYDNSVAQAVNTTQSPDPLTPLMRAYQNDKVQIRVLVGAHVFAHQFDFEGPTWLAEPAWKNSGYRSVQAMGLSEHFEFLFNVPSSSAPSTGRKCPDGMSQANCADYLYSPSFDQSGLANGMWGLFRSYDPTAKVIDPKTNKLLVDPLPNNSVGPNVNVTYSTCPAVLKAPAIKRVFNITAVTAQKALSVRSPIYKTSTGQLVLNDRGNPNDNLAVIYPSGGPVPLSTGIMYVRSEDLDANGLLNKDVPIEPLILRANAGDCIEVNLTNAIDPTNADLYKQNFFMAPPFNKSPYPSKSSRSVGLHPQLLAYDAAQSYGINVGWNSQGQKDQVIQFGQTTTYQWYAGKVGRDKIGALTYTPIEYGSLNLLTSDPVYQNINGLFGAMVIEPAGSTWKCGEAMNLGSCDPLLLGAPPVPYPPTSRASATVALANSSAKFREFVVMISDAMISNNNNPSRPITASGAVNYRTEPGSQKITTAQQAFRYQDNFTTDFSCMSSNQLNQAQPPPPTAYGDPKTPIFTAEVGDNVRFRMAHPFGTGASQVVTVHGHVWQRNPYTNNSTEIGNNKLSQWLGSRDNHGSSDHFDFVIDKAGGESGQAGDYLYTGFVPIQARQGAWGIFRVGDLGGVQQFRNAVCAPVKQPPNYVAPKTNDDLERFNRPLIKPGKP
jgi:hypothetical protein